MTISKTGNRSQYTGDGTTTAFSYGFRFFAATDLGVYVRSVGGVETKKVLTTDYTVSNTGTESGGTVTFLAAPASGEIVTILGEIPSTQGTDLADNDAFPAESLEGALDRLTRLMQVQTERLDRVPTLPISTTLSGLSLPVPLGGRAIGWNPAGDGFANLSNLPEATLVAEVDHAVIRYDNATGGLQESIVTIDDSGNVTGVVSLNGTTLTAAGLALLDDADEVAQRETLGAQAADATLTSLSGLLLEAGDILYATAVDTLQRLPKGTASQTLQMNAGATAPEWVTVVPPTIPDTLGENQAYAAQAIRTNNVARQNTTGRAIGVAWQVTPGTDDCSVQVSADNATWRIVALCSVAGGTGRNDHGYFVLPDNHYYRLNYVGAGTPPVLHTTEMV